MNSRILIFDAQGGAPYLRTWLEAAGHEVFEATGTLTAQEAAAARQADVIVTLEGALRSELAALVTLTQKLAPDAPLVLLSDSPPEDLPGLIQSAIFETLERPASAAALHHAVGRALRQRERTRAEHRRAEMIAAIEQLARRINVARDLDALCEAITEELGTALRVRLFSLFLHDELTGNLTLAASNHVPRQEVAALPLSSLVGPMKDAVDSRRPVIVSDFGRSTYARSPRHEAFRQAASATLPLLVRGELVGILNLNERVDSDLPFDPVEAGTLALAAEHLASAIAVRRGAARLAQALAELKQAQERLVRSERLAAVSKVVAGVAHAVKNPLTSLQFGIANVRDFVARHEGSARDGAAAVRRLDGMDRDIQQLRTHIDGLVSLARPDGRERTRCEPAAVVAAALDPLAEHRQRAGIHLATRFLPTAPVQADAFGFTQAVTNLVVNAFEAARDGGRVEVTVEPADGSRVRITVTDDGPGVPAHYGDAIFDLFFTTKQNGSGIGLSQVHVFCETHGGVAGHRSIPGQTSFWMELLVSGGG